MARELKFYREVRTLVWWFRLIGDELARSPDRTSADLAEAAHVHPDNKHPARTLEELTQGTRTALVTFSVWRLVSARFITQRVGRIPVPAQVVRLTAKGERLRTHSCWQQTAHLGGLHALERVRRASRPFAGAVAVAGTLATLVKLFATWPTAEAALVGAVGGLAVFVGQKLRRP
jgi:hypothetical protein